MVERSQVRFLPHAASAAVCPVSSLFPSSESETLIKENYKSEWMYRSNMLVPK